jgi:hypothetical protein
MQQQRPRAVNNGNNEMKTKLLITTIALSALGLAAQAETVTYVDWNSTGPGPGTVNGTLGGIGVTYTGELNFAQINNNGTYYYTGPGGVPNPNPYVNPVVGNTPPTSDMIAISGNGTPNTFTFSSPVTDPIMLLVSLGQVDPTKNTVYTFNQPFNILSDGPGWWGGPGTLVPAGNSVQGIEGDGSIQFIGTFDSLSFTTSNGEYWNGFTLGIVPDGGLTAGLLGGALLGIGALRRKLSV